MAVKKKNNYQKNYSRLRLYIFSSAATAKRLRYELKALIMGINSFLLSILLPMIPKAYLKIKAIRLAHLLLILLKLVKSSLLYILKAICHYNSHLRPKLDMVRL
ncbi:hypothetical protein BD560DRAFT_407593 [Blakeslea trispora]|nr:hypothetical protein BD560DRAFT_407593 [Blakeslea trispora]